MITDRPKARDTINAILEEYRRRLRFLLEEVGAYAISLPLTKDSRYPL